MAEIKYLDLTGLGYYDGKIKEYIGAQIEAAHGAEVVSIANAVKNADGKLEFTYTKADDSTGTFTVTKAELDAVIGKAADQAAGGAGLMTKEQADQLASLVNVGGEVNVIESISINGEAFAVADKAATATMTFDWESEGSDNIVLKIGNKEIGRIDTTKFVKDGIVKNAELITIPDDETATAEHPAGKYIKITWSDDATTDPTYINVTDLVDIHNVVGDAVQAGSLVKVNTTVTGKGTTAEPWKVSVVVDETALNAELAKFDTTLGVNAGEYITSADGVYNYLNNNSSVASALETLDSELKNVENTAKSSGVTSLGGKTGDITFADKVVGKYNVMFEIADDKVIKGSVDTGLKSYTVGGKTINNQSDITFAEVVTDVNTDVYFTTDENGYILGKTNIATITNGEIDALFA